MNLSLKGWLGPMLIPSTDGLTAAYRATRQSGINVEALSRIISYPVERQSYRTMDDYHYFWGITMVMSQAAIVVLLPWVWDKRPVSAYIRGEVETLVINIFFDAICQCFAPAQVEVPTIEIRLRQ